MKIVDYALALENYFMIQFWYCLSLIYSAEGTNYGGSHENLKCNHMLIYDSRTNNRNSDVKRNSGSKMVAVKILF